VEYLCRQADGQAEAGTFKVEIKLSVIYHHQMCLDYSLMVLTITQSIKWTEKKPNNSTNWPTL